MIYYRKTLFGSGPKLTAVQFDLIETDFDNNFVTVEDKELGIQREIKWGDKKLKKSKIIGEYEILFIYEDGSEKVERILE
ncbi:hypothetical protein POAR111328_10015 [Polynucleobacter arcticus]|uniref:Uncharacterized protein n=2 Tax=Polynucleobacter arcticus TaxID=1743165 RepID=A0A6M9PIU6_9BURK|nr:hypothetical protein DN92_04165 [Polynucleobacter arcticus]